MIRLPSARDAKKVAKLDFLDSFKALFHDHERVGKLVERASRLQQEVLSHFDCGRHKHRVGQNEVAQGVRQFPGAGAQFALIHFKHSQLRPLWTVLPPRSSQACLKSLVCFA
jgi:hypothetical protein